MSYAEYLKWRIAQIIGWAMTASFGVMLLLSLFGSPIWILMFGTMCALGIWLCSYGGFKAARTVYAEKITLKQSITPQEPIIKIRCTNCKTLNDDNAVYCKECGKELGE